MKCKSCGREVLDTAAVCEYCGYDLESFKKLTRIVVEEDPEVDATKKSNLVDNPVLAYIFGILSILSSLMYIYSPFVLDYSLFIVIIFLYFTFKFSKKPAKVKLKPHAIVGKGMAYFAISIIAFKFIYQIVGILLFQ